MAKVNATQWLQKWSQNLNAAGQYIKDGVNNVKEAPGVSAAAAAERMLANLTAAVQSGRWAAAVSSVPLSDWKDAMINKGIPRISQGTAQAVKTKTQNITELLNAVDQAASAAHALPKGGIEHSIARATAFMREMSRLAPRKQAK